MRESVTIEAKRDQIVFLIAAWVAAKLFVVDFKADHGTAQLAAPAISPQHLLSKLLVIGDLAFVQLEIDDLPGSRFLSRKAPSRPHAGTTFSRPRKYTR
jgi:hypothetical protein